MNFDIPAMCKEKGITQNTLSKSLGVDAGVFTAYKRNEKDLIPAVKFALQWVDDWGFEDTQLSPKNVRNFIRNTDYTWRTLASHLGMRESVLWAIWNRETKTIPKYMSMAMRHLAEVTPSNQEITANVRKDIFGINICTRPTRAYKRATATHC